MPSTVVASRSHGIGIVAAVGLVLVLVSACGQAGSTTATPTGAASTSSHAATTATATPVPASPSDTPRPTRTAGPTLPPSAALGTRLLATIDGVMKPCAMAATKDGVWVTGNGPSRLARLDPETNTIVDQVSLDGSPCGIAVDPDGRLWVALLSIGQVVAVDPASARVVATIEGLGANLWDLKAGFGSIWVVDRTKRELLRIDPASATIVDRLTIGPSGSGLAMTRDAVWVVDDIDGTVRRIDPVTMTVTSTTTLARGASWFADDGDALLVANRLDGSIVPFDGASGAAREPIDGGARSPLDGTVQGGRAYVPDGAARVLVEIDLASGSIAAVDALDGARNPFVAEVAFGDLWVLDYGGERIWRITP